MCVWSFQSSSDSADLRSNQDYHFCRSDTQQSADESLHFRHLADTIDLINKINKKKILIEEMN